MSGGNLREDQHRHRAQTHRQVGAVLAEVDHEWAAVPLFYSAYHIVKAALLRDPIWGDLPSLKALHKDLTPDDRFVGRHKGRRSRDAITEWGVTDLVIKLYRTAAPHYERLHQGSIDVRYSLGLPPGALPALMSALGAIEELDSRGELEAPVLWPKGQPDEEPEGS